MLVATNVLGSFVSVCCVPLVAFTFSFFCRVLKRALEHHIDVIERILVVTTVLSTFVPGCGDYLWWFAR